MFIIRTSTDPLAIISKIGRLFLLQTSVKLAPLLRPYQRIIAASSVIIQQRVWRLRNNRTITTLLLSTLQTQLHRSPPCLR